MFHVGACDLVSCGSVWETGTPALLSLGPCLTGHRGDSHTVELRSYFVDSPLPSSPSWEGQHKGLRSV